MEKILAAMAAMWPKIPKVLRRVVLLILVVCGLGFGATVGYLAWRSGFIEEQLGSVATPKDIKEQTEAFADQASSIADEAVTSALLNYDGQLKSYLDTVRQAAVDTTLKPMLNLMFRLEKRMQRIETAQKVTKDLTEDLPREMDERLRRMVEEKPVDNTAERFEELKAMLLQQNERLERIEKQRQSKVKL